MLVISRVVLFAVAIVLAIATTMTTAGAAVVVNAGDDFKIATDGWEQLDQAGRMQRWDVFEAKYAQIYENRIYKIQEPGWQSRIMQRRALFFPEVTALRDNMLKMFDEAGQIVAIQEARFKKQFPDMPQDIPVYFLPSLFSFNGSVFDLPQHGRSGLLMGVDFIVRRRDNLDVLFAHEFFHAYHEDKISKRNANESTTESTTETMATPLWLEGFATYVSGILNPTASVADLLMDPVLAKDCARPEFVRELAKLYESILTTDGETTYSDWFLMSGTTQPTRRGYCLGLHVVGRLAKTHDLSEMTSWSESRYSIEALKVLREIQSPLFTNSR